jgi:hypothetical protein
MKTLTDHQFKLAQDELIRTHGPHEIATATNREQRALMLYGRMHNPTVEDLKAFIDAINAENVPRPHGNVYMRAPKPTRVHVRFDDHPYEIKHRKLAHVGTNIDPLHDVEAAMRRVQIDTNVDIETAMMQEQCGDVDTWGDLA